MTDVDRRAFFGQAGLSLGSMGLASLLAGEESHAESAGSPHFRPRAKAVIYLFMAGGPSQLELFEHKPKLAQFSGQTPPESLTKGRRFAFLKGTETLLGPQRRFRSLRRDGDRPQRSAAVASRDRG